MPDIMNVDPLSPYMAMYTGANGSGKSIAIASWLEKGSVYFFDFDGRMASVSNYYRQRGLKRGQLTYDTWGPDNFYEALMEKLMGFTSNCPHAAIAIDSFTAFTITAVMFSIKRRVAAAKQPDISKIPIADMDDYKAETSAVTMALDLCKTIAARGTAVFWTAHPLITLKVEAGQQGKISNITQQTRYSAYGQKVDSLLPIYFNEIYNFEKDYDHANQRWARICRTASTAEVMAKTALNIPASIEWTDKSFYNVFTPLALEGNKLLDKEMPDTNINNNVIKL